MTDDFRVRRLGRDEALAAAPALGEILHDCVAGGAEVSFMADLTPEQATGFWLQQAQADDARISEAPRALMLPAPGETHEFGVAMVETFFRAAGWRVETIWECELKDRAALEARLADLLRTPPPPGP